MDSNQEKKTKMPVINVMQLSQLAYYLLPRSNKIVSEEMNL